ncbi:hypothetical protein [Enterobacter sp. 22466]|uniref:hypothetical protein n=1 Tax=Enterobacter sp. 22466 TaxID=3453924 RepID=UPI003F87A106
MNKLKNPFSVQQKISMPLSGRFFMRVVSSYHSSQPFMTRPFDSHLPDVFAGFRQPAEFILLHYRLNMPGSKRWNYPTPKKPMPPPMAIGSNFGQSIYSIPEATVRVSAHTEDLRAVFFSSLRPCPPDSRPGERAKMGM